MDRMRIGSNGPEVSRVALGTITFGEDWGWGASATESKRIYAAYREAGGNFLDTSDLYTDGSSESILGEVIGRDRANVVLATKYTMKAECAADCRVHRADIIQTLERSLKRLRTDYIDLYWMHMWDQKMPIDECMVIGTELIDSGKVKHIGLCDAPAWQIARSHTLSQYSKSAPVTAIQLDYNLLERTVERELIPCAEHCELGIIASTPLSGGLLTGKYENGIPADSRYANAKLRSLLPERAQPCAVVEVLVSVAEEQDATPAQVAIAWLLNQKPAITPIMGARTMAQMIENLEATKLTLNDEQLMRLDEISLIDPGFPQRCYDQKRGRVYRECKNKSER